MAVHYRTAKPRLGCFAVRGMPYEVRASVVPLGTVPYRAVYTFVFTVPPPLSNAHSRLCTDAAVKRYGTPKFRRQKIKI